MCAIFGALGSSDASHLTQWGLFGLQHRGQEGSGMACWNSAAPLTLRVRRGLGLVTEVFHKEHTEHLQGTAAIGHNRYSTIRGTYSDTNLQPVLLNTRFGWLALSHNGNLTNTDPLTQELQKKGVLFHTQLDTELILHLMARSKANNVRLAFIDALKQVEGAYSVLLLSAEGLLAACDPYGFRPLVLGRLGKTSLLSSESCALELLGAETIREVSPGEVIEIPHDGKPLQSFFPFPKKKAQQACVFEHVYFARPDSTLFGSSVYRFRKQLGKQLALEQPAPSASCVIPVPDSGVVAALGFAEQSGIPFEMGIIRSHYVGRTFIEPHSDHRLVKLRQKLSVAHPLVENREVVVIDDSIVRGTTSQTLVRLLREAKVARIHFRVASPPVRSPCYYGIDTPQKSELLAARHNLEEIKNFLGVDSLGYVSLSGLKKVASEASPKYSFCTSCFSGDYPTAVPTSERG